MHRETLHARALESAAAVLGGELALASYLNVSRLRLRSYLNGTARCPADVSRKLVHLLLEHDADRAAGTRSERAGD
jgi:hypothetical protein